MKFMKIFEAVADEFDMDVALAVVQIITIQLRLKPKMKELTGEKSFEQRVITKAKDVLCETDSSIVEQAIQVWRVTHDWDVRQTMAEIS